MKERKLHSAPTSIDADLCREMDVLVRDYKGLIDRARLDWISGRLKASDLAVRRSRINFRGDRVSLEFTDGSILKLSVLQPEWRPFATLCSMTRRDAYGWTVRGRSARGEALTCEVWQASLTVRR